jgi:hypothetical protein
MIGAVKSKINRDRPPNWTESAPGGLFGNCSCSWRGFVDFANPDC